MKPKIKKTAFGSITVGKKTYHRDIVIQLSGEVRKRRKKLSKRYFGTSHVISEDEIRDVYETGTRQLIVGTGQYDQVRLSAEAEAFLSTRDCEAILLATPDALKKWNETENESKAIGVFHITC